MAKMFYTLDETKAALGRNEEGIKQLAREGRLREFRDGPRLMFKADQVEALKADIAGGGEISLSAPESGSGLALAAEGKSGSTAGIPIADVPQGGSVGGIPSPGKLTQANTGSGAGTGAGTGGSGSGMLNLGGSGLGSGSGMLNLGGSGAASGSGLSAHGTRGGITIFDVDESNRVDPSAQTAINTAQNEQLNLEGVGSGSGLLDLTRESDDTSLGAVFDELTPGKTSGGGAAPRVAPSSLETQQGSGVGPAIVDTGRRASAPIFVEAADPMGAALGIASIVPIVCLGFACFILGALLLGYRPDILNELGDWQNGKVKTYIFAASGLTLLFGAVGYFVSSAMKK